MSWPILLLLCVLSSALASIFLKFGAESLTGSISISGLISNYMIWIGALFYAAAFLGYIYVLRIVPLSLAQPIITSGASVLTVVFAMIFLKESFIIVNWMGLVLICLGIFFLFFGRA